MKKNSRAPDSAQILSLATAVPSHVIAQADVEAFGQRLFRERPATFERLSGAYSNAGIDRRYSCVPLEWYERDHGWKDRNRLYIENAVLLLEAAAREALALANLDASDIDGIVTVSSTGLAVPSLDALLMERMPFRRTVQRLPVFGLGCAGGVLGLARTAALANAEPGSLWMFLVVELCGLTFRNADLSKSNIIATALFGDGAAGTILQSGAAAPSIRGWGEYCWEESLDIMGWNIEEDGLGVQFSRDIPNLVRNDLPAAIQGFLTSQDTETASIANFLFHPGGAKVLSALEEALDLSPEDLLDTRSVLREYGNMSAATLLFVLKRAIERGLRGKSLLGALGPGFTAGFALADL